MARFEAAGLAVPPVEINLYRDSEACGGHRGIFNPGAERIDVCVAEPFVVLHEIAHAWAHDHLDSEARDRHVAANGFESWNDSGTSWSERGSEHAADTIAWGLLAEPLTIGTPDGPLANAHEAFKTLTGVESPRIER